MIKVYQINEERDTHNMMFARYSFVERKGFDFSIYDLVWAGDGDENLDAIYRRFNFEHPADFRGHSLSVSDVVQTGDGYFFCDSYGWKKLDI